MYYIYCYTNKTNKHCYVGQTYNIRQRRAEHTYCAMNAHNPEYNSLFHSKLRQYGEDNFEFTILEEIEDSSFIDEREQYWIEQKESYVRYGKGYNLTTGGLQFRKEKQITDVQALEIINLLKTSNLTGKAIGEQYNLNPSYISRINQGKIFKQLNEQYPIRKFKKSEDELKELVNLLRFTNKPLTEIAKEMGMGYSTVKKYNSGFTKLSFITSYPIRKPVSTIASQVASKESIDTILETGVGINEN